MGRPPSRSELFSSQNSSIFLKDDFPNASLEHLKSSIDEDEKPLELHPSLMVSLNSGCNLILGELILL